MLLTTMALAQALTAVPPGARAVTVMVCDEPDGCQAAYAAMAAHCSSLGIPLLDFDAVASAGPAGGEARAGLDDALRRAGTSQDRAALESAREAIRDTPLTLRADEIFALWLRLADARLRDGDEAAAIEALEAAAASSGGRVWDLPALSSALTERYLGIVNNPPGIASLTLTSDVPGTAFIDGAAVGETPLTIEVPAGWHRVSVERTGRRTAWVGEVVAPAGTPMRVAASVTADDAPAAMEAAVIASIAGKPPPPDVGERIADWARSQGLRTVRFVRVVRAGAETRTPEEQLTARDGAWDVHATWLDTAAGRFDSRGSGPAALRAAADPDRFSLGLNIGYARLQASQPTGPDPHDHIAVGLVAVATLMPELALDARVGLWASAQPYYLYEDWLSSEVVPVHLGLRWTPGESGLYLGAHGLAVVPMALGGEAFLGFNWSPTTRWRIGLEGHGGMTDKGPVFGGTIGAAFSG